jgi:hypothetical protein
MTVDTKSAPRRDLTYATVDDLINDLDRIERADGEGRLARTGNWTPGQNCEHCAKFMRFAYDGFPSRAPAIMRFFARMVLLKKALGPEPFPAGFKLPKAAAALLPSGSVSNRTGINELRTQAVRIKNGEPMTQPSPLLGPLDPDEWVILQLKHCAMHLSFIKIT